LVFKDRFSRLPHQGCMEGSSEFAGRCSCAPRGADCPGVTLLDVVFDGFAQTVDFELGHILGADRCVRLQTRLDEASDARDDAGDRNLEALRREGARLVEEHSADLDRIVAAVTPAA
jgi:hypothetical protein